MRNAFYEYSNRSCELCYSPISNFAKFLIFCKEETLSLPKIYIFYFLFNINFRVNLNRKYLFVNPMCSEVFLPPIRKGGEGEIFCFMKLFQIERKSDTENHFSPLPPQIWLIYYRWLPINVTTFSVDLKEKITQIENNSSTYTSKHITRKKVKKLVLLSRYVFKPF